MWEKCRDLKNTLQPFIIDKGMQTAQNFYVYFDETFLKFASCLKAFDCAFKIVFVLNLKDPHPCIKAWTFVQKYFYEIRTSHDNCQKSFGYVDYYVKHLKFIHILNNCDLIGRKRFSRFSFLKRHMLQHEINYTKRIRNWNSPSSCTKTIIDEN